jgi:hypothetical protein
LAHPLLKKLQTHIPQRKLRLLEVLMTVLIIYACVAGMSSMVKRKPPNSVKIQAPHR